MTTLPTDPNRAPFHDALETRTPTEREADWRVALPRQIAHAQRTAPAFAASLAGIDAASIVDRAALATLPVLRKHELLARQNAADTDDPFGGCSAIGWGTDATGQPLRPPAERARRVFVSPGPLHEPEADAPDDWRMARALHAAGFRAGELVHNAFSYHFTPAGAMMESGAFALGCTVFPAGTGQTEQQVEAIRRLRPAAYTGTPGFLRLILEKADALGVALPSLKKASVSGEAFPPALRDAFAARGIVALQSYGTADLGLIAYETVAREGLVVDEDVVVEIVRPGTGEALPDGEVGEVVVTTLSRGYPLIRFGTGDLSAVLPGPCPTGRTNLRLRGWLGRADQTAKVRGLFVHPGQVADVQRRHPEVRRARLVIDGAPGADRMTLRCEVEHDAPDGLAVRLAKALRETTRLRGEVELLLPGALPNDGKLIDDLRPVGAPPN